MKKLKKNCHFIAGYLNLLVYLSLSFSINYACAEPLKVSEKVHGFFDPIAGKMWFVNHSDQDLFLSFPGSSFSVKGFIKGDEINMSAIQSRESWFLTLPKDHKPLKEDSIHISDIGDLAKNSTFVVLLSARPYLSKEDSIILGKYFKIRITMKTGNYKDLEISSLYLYKIQLNGFRDSPKP